MRDLYLVRRVAGPVVPPMQRVPLPSGSTAVALHLPLPRHPYGDEMNIQFDVVPDAGHLVVGERPVSAGERLSVSDFGKLAYLGEGRGEPQVATYTVTDGAGNSARGSIALSSGSQAATTFAPSHPRGRRRCLPKHFRRTEPLMSRSVSGDQRSDLTPVPALTGSRGRDPSSAPHERRVERRRAAAAGWHRPSMSRS